MGSQHPSPTVKTFRNFEPQSWPETITTRDAKSARLKGPRTSHREIISGISWPNHGRKRSYHVMDASCRQTTILSGKNQSFSKQQEEQRTKTKQNKRKKQKKRKHTRETKKKPKKQEADKTKLQEGRRKREQQDKTGQPHACTCKTERRRTRNIQTCARATQPQHAQSQGASTRRDGVEQQKPERKP